MVNCGPWAQSGPWPIFWYSLWTKNGFYIFRGFPKKIKKFKQRRVCNRPYGPQCLKYLLSSHLQKKFANPWCTLNRFLFFGSSGNILPRPRLKQCLLEKCNRWAWNTPRSQAGDCLCLSVFFCAKCGTWCKRRSEQLADGDDRGVYSSHWKTNIPETLSLGPFLKPLRCQSLLGLPYTSPRWATQEPPALLISLALAAYLRRKNGITSACLLASERTLDKYALSP